MSLLAQLWLQALNALANKSPALYYALVSIFATIGYGYVFIFPILAISSLGLIINAILTKSPFQWDLNNWLVSIAILSTGFVAAWISLKIFKIKHDLPAGKPMLAKDFPTLIASITDLRESFEAPEIHHIKLTPHFRIEIIRTPVSGFPLKYSNTLLIGLPIMSCTSPLQFKLLLARQIGHLAQARTSIVRRLIYLRQTLNIYNYTYSRSWKPETILLRLFFTWYSPLFNLTTTMMVRLESYRKDNSMLEITPSENAAAVVSDFHIKKLFMETQFWPELNDSAYKLESPPYLPHACMSKFIANELDPEKIKFLFESEIVHEVEIDSEIPSLKNRLHTMGYDELVPSDKNTENAAKYFFEDKTDDIYKQLDNVWHLKNKKIWGQKYNQGLQEKEQLKKMQNQVTKSLLSESETKEYLFLIEKYVDPENALPLYKEVASTGPQDSELCLDLGRLLLEADDSNGINILITSMEQSSNNTVECCNNIVEYLVKHGDNKKAQHYRRIILEYQAEH